MYIDLNSRKEMLTNQKDTLYVMSEMVLECFGDEPVLENLDMTNLLQNLVLYLPLQVKLEMLVLLTH